MKVKINKKNYHHNEQTLKRLIPGDLIKYKRTFYSHYAIYIDKIIYLISKCI